MKRHLFNLSAALSTLICAAAITVWAASLVRADRVSGSGGATVTEFESSRGVITHCRRLTGGKCGTDTHGWAHYAGPTGIPAGDPRTRRAFGFGIFFERSMDGRGESFSEWTVAVPHETVVLLSAILPCRVLLARRRRRAPGFEVTVPA